VDQSFTGRASYYTNVATLTGELLVVLRCRLDQHPDERVALADSACPWCILPPSAAVALGIELGTDRDTRLHTRFGTLTGELIRLPVIFVADEGEPAEIEATWFLSPDWPGPLVIGWTGCLERMRFAFDPQRSDFYFAEY
jgi:hypothetical protein